MPQLGETVTEGTITKWFKAVGDSVARDEPLFEVSTDKVDSEVPSPAEGVLTAILVQEGDTVDVGVALAVISADGSGPTPVAAPEPQAAPAAGATAPAVPTPAPVVPAPVVPAPVATTTPLAALPDEPVAPAAPATAAIPGAPVAPVAPAAATSTDFRPVPPGGVDQSQVLSPVVRRLLTDHGLDPSSIQGTGLGGRITRADVESVIEHGAPPAQVPSIRDGATAPSAPPAAPAPAGLQATGAPAPESAGADLIQVPGERDEVVPFTNIRRRTAEHMVRSKATSAHTLMVKEIDYERVEQVRRTHGERFREEEGFSLTYLPFVARASVEALAEYPHLNASVGEDALLVHRDINLGIAVDLDNQGLIVPVVHRAEELNLRGMARRIRDIADRARNKRLSLDDISGGTFSITNAGPFGTLLTGAIINQPQVAILSTDGVSRKPVVVELSDGTESIGIHSMGLIAMNFDHRAVDGAYVARFLARVSAILDDRDWAGEL
jgi:2-oxoglutarate dehydrogenase E2 component (dihydrolipoamide succinyltransferase)